ncbi:MAG: MarR family transcriptional regulator [Bacteroidaceae bacterium]|nr:MarR family transcriptional regulator [Bacteroidaceae bacterium]
MIVQEIFDLRKQGRIEEAYDAIRPVFAVHNGKYTTLRMFWTASDVFKLRLEQGRVEEAEMIYKAMLRIQPSVEDDERHSAARFMHYAEGRLIKASEKFRRRYFAIKRARDKDANLREESETSLNSPEQEQTLLEFKDEGINIPSDIPPESSDNPSSETLDIPPTESSKALSSVQQSVLDAIKAHPGLKVPGISDETGIPAKSVERHVKALTTLGLIEHRGSKKTGGYHAL